MPRFYVTSDQVQKDGIIITGSDVNHIKNVLRLKAKDKIEVFDPKGQVYLCEIEKLSPDLVRGKIIKSIQPETELKADLTLAQCLPKGKKMDLIIQKATELGINRIIPVIAERSIPRIEEKADKKGAHWQKIAKEAAEQSGRTRIPQISPLIYFTDLLKQAKNYDLAVMPWEGEKETKLSGILAHGPTGKLLITIGPEGGFSQAEVELAKKAGFKTVSLGKRILRCETAAIFSLAVAVSALET